MKSSLVVVLSMVVTFSAMIYLTAWKDGSIAAEQEVKSRVVKIESYDRVSSKVSGQGGQGTGTLLGHNRILTNAHLFPDSPKGTVIIRFRRYDEDTYHNAVVESSDTAKDVAILTFKGQDETLPLKIAAHWKLGEPLIILGNPREGDFILDHTQINAFSLSRREDGYVRDAIVFDCNKGGPGFSGGGVYDFNGEFVGIFELGDIQPNIIYLIAGRFAGITFPKQQCYAIPNNEIKGEI